ncbi:MAG: helix-turn-helix domain-containing protein [Actinomycetota bacterium]
MVQEIEADELTRLVRVRSLTRSGAAKSIRVAAGLSLREVAQSIEVSPATILRWERRDRVPQGDRALRYLSVLEGLLRR